MKLATVGMLLVAFQEVVGTQNSQTGLLLQLGVGGIFALLMLRETLAFLKARRLDASGGADRALREERHRAVAQAALDSTVIPVLVKQIDILTRLEERTGRQYDMSLRAEVQAEETRRSLDALRASNHAIVASVQKVLDRGKGQ